MCRRNKAIPATFRIKPPFVSGRTTAIANRAALGFITQAITALHLNIKRCLKDIYYLHHIIILHLSKIDYLWLLHVIFSKCERDKAIMSYRLALKFGRLMAKLFPIHINKLAVHNLTTDNLNILQLDALSKIGKFALPPRKVPRLDVIMASEKCIAKFFDKITDHNAFRASIADALNKCRHYYRANINPYEISFLRKLSNEDRITVTQADKGGGVVYMLRKDYHSMALNHLSDTTVYQQCNYSLSVYQQRVLDNLEWANKFRGLNSYYVRKGTVKDPVYPKIRFLPKTHKELVNGAFKARPIVNTKGSPIQGISTIIFEILRPYAQKLPHCLRNGNQVISKLKNLNFTNRAMFSLDVQSMFTSMKFSIIKPAIAECLNKDKDNLLRRHDLLPEHIDFLIWVLVTQQFFTYNNAQYQQSEGLFMGLAASGPISDIVMGFLELKMFRLFPELDFYGRYVDDTLIVCSNETAKRVLDYFNSFNENLKFEMEENIRGGINFLDISLAIDPYDQLHTSVYRKPTCASRFIHFNSYAPMAHKVNTIDFMVRRAFYYCSSLIELRKEIDFCVDTLTKLSYPYDLLKSRIKHINIQFLNSEEGFFKDLEPQKNYGIITENNEITSLVDNNKWKNVTLVRRSNKAGNSNHSAITMNKCTNFFTNSSSPNNGNSENSTHINNDVGDVTSDATTYKGVKADCRVCMIKDQFVNNDNMVVKACENNDNAAQIKYVGSMNSDNNSSNSSFEGFNISFKETNQEFDSYSFSTVSTVSSADLSFKQFSSSSSMESDDILEHLSLSTISECSNLSTESNSTELISESPSSSNYEECVENVDSDCLFQHHSLSTIYERNSHSENSNYTESIYESPYSSIDGNCVENVALDSFSEQSSHAARDDNSNNDDLFDESLSSSATNKFTFEWHASEFRALDKLKKPNVYAVFPYYPPMISRIKKLLTPLGIIASYKSTHPFTVNTRNPNPEGIVYTIPCQQCDRPYIGQTKFSLKKRIAQHIRGFKQLDPNQSGTVSHFLKCAHSPIFSEAKHIMRVASFRDRAVAEAYHILEGCAYNRATIGRCLLHYFQLDKAANNNS